MPNYLPKGESGFNALFRRYKLRAKHCKMKFTLSKDEFKKLTSSNCHYCGIKPSQIAKETNATPKGIEHSKYQYNGLDRKDNTKGYTINNVVPCCRLHNEWKRALPYKQFIKLIHKTSKYLRIKR